MNKIFAIMIGAVLLTACEDDAHVASRNLSKAADMFEVTRRVIFYNGITGGYILTIEGRCSLGTGKETKSLTVTCKIGPTDYKKHFLGLSDNVTWFAEQVTAQNVSVYHYRVVFKPQVIVPELDVRGDMPELLRDRH